MNFEAAKFILRDGTILISYIHPLTKRKCRKTFASAILSEEYKIKMESKFNLSNNFNYEEMTFEELTILFLHERPNSTFFKMRLHLIDLIETFGHLKISNITTPMLRAWLEQIQVENKIADTTMRSLKCSLDRIFEFLIEKEVISESPLKEIFYRKTPADAISRNYLSVKEIEGLLDAVKKYSPGYLYPILKLFVETGAKVNEVVDLKWSQVDCVRRTVEIAGTDKSQSRILPISEELAIHLSKQQKETGVVFKTYYREQFTRIKLTRTVNEFKAKGFYRKNWNLLDLRHSFGVHFLTQGGSMNELQKNLGHANIFDTKRIFGLHQIGSTPINSRGFKI